MRTCDAVVSMLHTDNLLSLLCTYETEWSRLIDTGFVCQLSYSSNLVGGFTHVNKINTVTFKNKFTWLLFWFTVCFVGVLYFNRYFFLIYYWGFL